MSPAVLRTARSAAKGSTSAAARSTLGLVVVGLVLALTVVLAAPQPARAAAEDLTVSMDRALTFTGDSAALLVSGDAVAALDSDSTIEVRIDGPADLKQITQASPALSQAGSLTVAVDSLPEVARPSGSQLHLPIPAVTLPTSSGAYRVTVEIRSGGTLVASGATWMGRVPAGSTLDLAFVWRVEGGIHRDVQGRFFDTWLSDACAAGGALSGLDGLSSRFPEWRFSLAVEPVLLTELRDMADGYTLADGSTNGKRVVGEDQTALDAKAVLGSLTRLADSNTVEIAPGPYAGADLGLLGTQDWRDGFEQVQLGKQEVVQTLGLGLTPAGAYVPGLDLAGAGLGDLGKASVDHVLVDSTVAAGLAEPPAKGTVTVRAHDDDNDRVTLILADSDLRALVGPPWDASALFAGIACLLPPGGRDALVVTQGADFSLPPQAYLDAIGRELHGSAWIRTQTMSDLIQSHPPGTRPVLFNRPAVLPKAYIGQTLFAAVRAAHAATDLLAAAADPASVTLGDARRALFMAESGWWSRRGVSPQEASAGLAYAVQAETGARGELAKVTLKGIRHSLIFGHDGKVTVPLNNGASSVMNVELRLSGQGLSFPQGATVKARLKAGDNSFTVPVSGLSNARELTVALAVGDTVLGRQQASLSFLTVSDVLPWAGIAVAVIVVIAVAVVLIRHRRRRRFA